MASSAPLELDFFGLNNNNNDNDNDNDNVSNNEDSVPEPVLLRRRSFCGISKINPEIVKTVIASAKPQSLHPTPLSLPFPEFLLFKHLPFPASSTHDMGPDKAPLTIFYNGTVCVFDMAKEKAEDVIKYAVEKGSSISGADAQVDDPPSDSQFQNNILDGLNDGDLPIKRKKSLQRFFEKRKERLISVSPYHNQHVAPFHQKPSF